MLLSFKFSALLSADSLCEMNYLVFVAICPEALCEVSLHYCALEMGN